ncbi:MAG: hypothetical protein FD157_828 [Rhodocyclaceae bacterium]|nr:MAG: hypothetical protein FD157_828 [Rhodocyclaceae bacterium]TND05212.1 MAG: hypothetical protein FD118_616 [Rhodocyclaceae bacterium]
MPREGHRRRETHFLKGLLDLLSFRQVRAVNKHYTDVPVISAVQEGA